jgi:hypothetical protein
MNTDAIFDKYAQALDDISSSVSAGQLSIDAMLLALRLAIQETTDANAALVNDMSAIIANLRAQEPGEQRQIEQSAKIADLRYALIDANEDATSARRELTTLLAERDALRQQLAQLDADNADLTKKLAQFNGAAAVSVAPAIHTNGNSNGTAPAPFNWKQPISTELADYWESLDAGRRTFRQLDKRIRLDLVQTALASFEQMPTQAAFNAAKPEWMPTATSICTAFACKWEDMPSLKWEQVKP